MQDWQVPRRQHGFTVLELLTTTVVLTLVFGGALTMVLHSMQSFDEEIQLLVVDQNGFLIDHPECLTYIPQGPHKGFYSSPMGKDGTGGPKDVLAKINGLDGSAFMYPTQFSNRGLRGMTPMQDSSGNWVIFAHANKAAVRRLVSIDPATGLDTLIMPVTQIYEGIAEHPEDGKIYAVTGWELWVIDYLNFTETMVAPHAHPRTEALEYAYGDSVPAITVPGVDTSWTTGGALFCFAQNYGLMVMNPATG